MLNLELSNDEQETPGWVSMSDVLMLTTVLLLAVSYGAVRYSNKAAADVGGRMTLLDEARAHIAAITEERDGLAADRTELLARIELLEEQLEVAHARIALFTGKNTDFAEKLKEHDELSQLIAVLRMEKEDLQSQLRTARRQVDSTEKLLAEVRDELETATAALWKEQDLTTQLTKDLGSAKEKLTSVELLLASAQKQIETMTSQIADRSRDITDLRKRLAAAVTELADEQKNAVLLKRERNDTLKLLETAKMEIAELTKELSKATLVANALRAENRRSLAEKYVLVKQKLELEKMVQEHEATIRQLKAELSKSKNDYENRIKDFELALKKQNDRIIKPLESARLVVRVRTQNLADDLDLDIYVQDPRDRLCSWKRPRILESVSERATLIPSEDLRFSSLIGDDTGATEEVFYSSEPLEGGDQPPYLVFCMVRQIGEFKEGRTIDQTIEWEVTIKDGYGDKRILKGVRVIAKTGAVLVSDAGERYPGLIPLTGFLVSDASRLDAMQLADNELPKLLRGWEPKSLGKNTQSFEKLRDGEINGSTNR